MGYFILGAKMPLQPNMRFLYHINTLQIFSDIKTMDEKVLSGVKRTILVLSGKGGVGKSTVAAQLALAFQQRGKNVGILDIDLCGPSIPKMFGVDNMEVHQCDEGWLPVFTNETQSMAIMSIAFLLSSSNDAVVWRGPKKNAMIKQFLTDVAWGNRDILIIDTPPGTSDEHITVMESLKASEVHIDGAVLVTTPQAVAVGDVRRELTFCRKAKLDILGIVENMSGFVCPNCKDCTNIFSKGGGQALAGHAKVPFLGAVPIDPNISQSAESGINFIEKFESSVAANIFKDISKEIFSD